MGEGEGGCKTRPLVHLCVELVPVVVVVPLVLVEQHVVGLRDVVGPRHGRAVVLVVLVVRRARPAVRVERRGRGREAVVVAVVLAVVVAEVPQGPVGLVLVVVAAGADEAVPGLGELVGAVCGDDVAVGVDEVGLLGADVEEVYESCEEDEERRADADDAADDDVPVLLGEALVGGVLGAGRCRGGGGGCDCGVVVGEDGLAGDDAGDCALVAVCFRGGG